MPKDVYAFEIREFSCFPSYQRIDCIPLRDGDTLHVMLKDADELRKSSSLSRFLEEYTVDIQWQESWGPEYVRPPRPVDRFDQILFHGYDTKDSISMVLGQKYRAGSSLISFQISEECWPQFRTHPNGEREKLKYLCQLSPQRQIMLVAKAVRYEEVLYGCPRAASLQEPAGTQHCDVEIVSYE